MEILSKGTVSHETLGKFDEIMVFYAVVFPQENDLKQLHQFINLNKSGTFSLSLPSLSLWYTAQKMSKYWVFSGLYFPVFGLNTEFCAVNVRIQSKCGKYRPERILYLDTFDVVVVLCIYFSKRHIWHYCHYFWNIRYQG